MGYYRGRVLLFGRCKEKKILQQQPALVRRKVLNTPSSEIVERHEYALTSAQDRRLPNFDGIALCRDTLGEWHRCGSVSIKAEEIRP
jgi:hypothetical protein